jgi:hypothetical protein
MCATTTNGFANAITNFVTNIVSKLPMQLLFNQRVVHPRGSCGMYWKQPDCQRLWF